MPLQDYEDPLWYNQTDFLPWIEHVKDAKRLSIIDDPSAEVETLNKKLQVKMDKDIVVTPTVTPPIKQDPEEVITNPKRRDGRAEKRSRSRKGGTKRVKLTPVEEPKASASGSSKARSDAGGKSPRTFIASETKSKSDTSDIDTASSTDSE